MHATLYKCRELSKRTLLVGCLDFHLKYGYFFSYSGETKYSSPYSGPDISTSGCAKLPKKDKLGVGGGIDMINRNFKPFPNLA